MAAALPRLLLLEDTPEVRQLFRIVTRHAYEVDDAATLAEAYAHLDTGRYDGFVVDIHLAADESGVDFLRTARQHPSGSTVPALALTAYAMPGDREKLLSEGFDMYLAKPFLQAQLLEALQALVARRA